MVNRYSRQWILPEIGREGQIKLHGSRVAIIGCGALGTVHAESFARAGVGSLLMVDRDLVEMSNLQRQVLFGEADIGRPKAEAAAARIREINSSISVDFMIADVNSENIEDLLRGSSLVMDGTDNFRTRFLINDACTKMRIPWVYAGVVQTRGMTMAIVPGRACLQCLLPWEALLGQGLTCDREGVLGTAVQVVAAMADTSGLKILLGAEAGGALLNLDAWRGSWYWIPVERNSNCECCGRSHFLFLEAGHDDRAVMFCCRDAVQIIPARRSFPDFITLAEALSRVGEVRFDPYMLVFREGEYEGCLFADGRAIIKGTEDEKKALSFYSRYFGC